MKKQKDTKESEKREARGFAPKPASYVLFCVFKTVFVSLVFIYGITGFTSKSHACGPICVVCVPLPMAWTIDLVEDEHDETREHIEAEFDMHEDFLINVFWDIMLPAMMKMTEQISAVAMQQMLVIGTFFDAKQQLQVQRLLQMKEAKIRQDYIAANNIELCNIGTHTRTLMSSESYAKMNSFVLSQLHGPATRPYQQRCRRRRPQRSGEPPLCF